MYADSYAEAGTVTPSTASPIQRATSHSSRSNPAAVRERPTGRTFSEMMPAVKTFARWFALSVAAGGGITSSAVMARADAGGDGRVGLAVVLTAGGAAMAAMVLCLVDGAWDVRTKQAWWPGRFAWVVPLASVPVITVAGFLMYPLTFESGRPHDPSWFAVVAAMAFLVHPTGFLLGLGAIGLTAVPIVTVVRCLPGALRRSRDDARGVLLGMLTALLAPWATVVAIGLGANRPYAAVVAMVTTDAGWWSVSAWFLTATAAACVTALRWLGRSGGDSVGRGRRVFGAGGVQCSQRENSRS